MKIGSIVTNKLGYRLALALLSAMLIINAFQELRLAWVLAQVQFVYDLTILPHFLETHLSLFVLSKLIDGASIQQAFLQALRLSDVLLALSLMLVFALTQKPSEHRISQGLIGISLLKFSTTLIILIFALSSTSPNFALALLHGLAYTLWLMHLTQGMLLFALWIDGYKH